MQKSKQVQHFCNQFDQLIEQRKKLIQDENDKYLEIMNRIEYEEYYLNGSFKKELVDYKKTYDQVVVALSKVFSQNTKQQK